MSAECADISSLSMTADGRLMLQKTYNMQFLKIYCVSCSKIAAKVRNQIIQWIRDRDAPKWNQHTDFEGKKGQN